MWWINYKILLYCLGVWLSVIIKILNYSKSFIKIIFSWIILFFYNDTPNYKIKQHNIRRGSTGGEIREIPPPNLKKTFSSTLLWKSYFIIFWQASFLILEYSKPHLRIVKSCISNFLTVTAIWNWSAQSAHRIRYEFGYISIIAVSYTHLDVYKRQV